MLHISNTKKIDTNDTIQNLYREYNTKEKKSEPITISMKKSLSLDTFWPNTPPSNSPNYNILYSLQKFFKKKI